MQDPDGSTALHGAASRGKMRCLAMLVAWGASCQVLNSAGKLAADLAAERGYPGIAAFLAQAYLRQALSSVLDDPVISKGALTAPISCPHLHAIFISPTICSWLPTASLSCAVSWAGKGTCERFDS